MENMEDLKVARDKKMREKEQYEIDRQQIEEKLSRLRLVEKRIATIKDEVQWISQDVREKSDQQDDWRGQKYTQYNTMMNDQFAAHFKNYHQDLDYVHDEVCDMMTKVENESLEIGGILGRIASTLNDLGNEIEKLLN